MESALAGGTYEIVLGAVVDEDWSAWFSAVEITTAGPTTTLRGTVVDQPALHGLLGHVRDLAVPLVSVRRLDARHAPREVHDDPVPVIDPRGEDGANDA